MRTAALVGVVALVALLVSGCEKRAGLLAAQRDARVPSTTSAPKPPPTWRLGQTVTTKATSVLRDVVAVDATHAWAVGLDAYDPANPDATGVPFVQRWDGRTWSRVDLPGVTWHGGLSLVAADSATNVWAVGSSRPAPAGAVVRVLRHDGDTWAEVPLPAGTTAGTTITDLAVAGGHTWLTGYRGGQVVVLQWDGLTWQRHAPPAECTQGGTSFGGIPTFCNFTGITAFATDDVWVAGNAAWPGFKGPLLFHWDGTRWTPVEVGLTNAVTSFSEIAGRPGDLWAVGHTAGYGGPIAVQGDGRTWRVVEGLPTARHTDVAVDADGNPWVLENFPKPSATLATFRDGRWAGTEAPLPPDTVGISLHGITAVPGTPRMFAVGNVDLPGRPRLLQSVVLEYRR